MFIIKLYSTFKDEDYEIKPLSSDDPFYFIKKHFHKPKLKNWVLEHTVEDLVKHYVEGDGTIQSEEDIISINYISKITRKFDSVEIMLTGRIFVKGNMLDYHSEYRQELIRADFKRRGFSYENK